MRVQHLPRNILKNVPALLVATGLALDLSLWTRITAPVLGRFIEPHLNGGHTSEEAWQASKLVETLKILDAAGVYGAFVSQFVSEINPYSDDPRCDLDMAGAGLAKYYEGGRHGTTYPDMPWEPKESFRAVAEYYRNH